jgi:hypothetical protein
MYRHRIRSLLGEEELQKERSQEPHVAFQLPRSDQHRDLLQLLVLVVGDAALLPLTAGQDEVVVDAKAVPLKGGRDDVVLCLLDYQEELILELLLRTAVRNRMQLDAWEQQRVTMADGTKGAIYYTAVRVGDLKRGERDWAPMALREGCNKIIHADRFAFQMTKPGEGGFGPSLTGIIETVGTNRDEPWCSRLNVASYVRASIYNAYGGFDFPHGWMARTSDLCPSRSIRP